MNIKNLKFPVQPSPVDPRDYTPDMVEYRSGTLPEYYKGPMPKIYNQGSTSMCVAFALKSLKEIQEFQERGIYEEFSPGFIYGNRSGRYAGEGMFVKDALKDLKSFGVPRNSEFPITGSVEQVMRELDKVFVRVAPYAIGNSIEAYIRLEHEADIKRAIMDDGGVILGAMVYEKFFTPKNGIIADYVDGEQKYGGHAMLITGWTYIDAKLHWITVNSWGEQWGDKGLCYIPYDYKGIFEIFGATDRPLKPHVEFKILMKIGNNIATVIRSDRRTEYITLDVPPKIEGERTLVPLRFVAEAMDAEVEWNQEYQSITITKR